MQTSVDTSSNLRLVKQVMFRLLPAQILLALVESASFVISSLFASNVIGIGAMGAIGLYSPISKIVLAGTALFVGGSQILCGRYLGANQRDELQATFVADVVAAFLFSAAISLALLVLGGFDLTGIFTDDPLVRSHFNGYLIGNSLGIVPMVVGNQLSAFLFMENQSTRTVVASIAHVVMLTLGCLLFVSVLGLEAFGLALAAAVASWVYLAIMAHYFLTKGSHLAVRTKRIRWGACASIIRLGVPNALSYCCEAILVLIINVLILYSAHSEGLSAYTAVQSALSPFWSVIIGMLAVSRLMFSISVGEEDLQTLDSVMRVVLQRFLPMTFCMAVGISICAVPLTQLYYRDAPFEVWSMTVSGLRIVPLYMPLYLIQASFVAYGQTVGKRMLVYVLSLLDGLVCIATYSSLLMPFIGMLGLYIAFLLDGITTSLVVLFHSYRYGRRLPRSVNDFLAIPRGFGVPRSQRLDYSVRGLDDVARISEQVTDFCLERGVDQTRAKRVGLALEEMSANIVEHGFTKDKKPHAISVRVVHKLDELTLCLKDDCVPFDPGERLRMVGDDVTRNIGIRLVFRMARDVQYQNILGLNVLTIKM